MALVLLIEYEIGIPADKNPAFDMHRTLQTTQKGNNVVTTVTIGAAAYIPMTSAGTLDLSNNTKDGNDADKLDIELGLRTDELCGVLSPNPVFNWRSGMKGDDRTGPRVVEGVDSDEPVLGFDLQAFTFDKKKVDNGYRLSDVDKEPAKDSPLSAADDSIDNVAVKAVAEEKDGSSDIESGSEKAEQQPPRNGSRYHPSKVPKRDDDMESLADSLVGGDSVASILRLDRDFYAIDGGSPRGDIDVFRSARGFDEPLIPKDRNSLLGRSLQARMGAASLGRGIVQAMPHRGGAQNPLMAPRGLPVEDDPSGAVIVGNMQRAITARVAASNFPVYTKPGDGSFSHARELSRGNRARLGRYGISTSGMGMLMSPDGVTRQHPPGRAEKRAADLELEATDDLALNEISFLFAGYRHGAGGLNSGAPPIARQRVPRSVYFTFQFFTCSPIKTEVHRLLPADLGEMNVLCRDEQHARDEQPLSHRFSIDCSDSSPLEAIEFAEYLAQCSMQIDVWDADSLLFVGSCMFPLKRLLRQGQRGAKCALECDVVDAEYDAPVGASGTSSLTVTDEGGPVSGIVVGSVNIIAENLGTEGRQKTSAYMRHLKNGKESEVNEEGGSAGFYRAEINPIDGLNWRAMGVNKPGSGDRPGSRAKNIVRARPLSESNPELSRALQDQQRYASAGPSMRSLLSVRGNASVHTLNYDDIMVLFKRFQGSQKGTLQYEGSMLSLLDVPSWSVSLRKLTDAVSKAMCSGDNVDAVIMLFIAALT